MSWTFAAVTRTARILDRSIHRRRGRGRLGRARFPPFKTVNDYYAKWEADGYVGCIRLVRLACLARLSITAAVGSLLRPCARRIEATGACGGACGCGGAEETVEPELDVREVPHALRHATVFGALDAVPAGTAMVLVAPHDPLPLLAQIEQRSPGVFSVEYLERGPDAWRLRFSHL